MKPTAITILILLSLVSAVGAQAPDTVWTKTYGLPSGAYSVSIVPASDGGYFVGATIYGDTVIVLNGESDRDFWVLRLNEEGDTLWTRRYGDPLWREYAAQLAATSDGGFVIAGNSYQRDAEDQMFMVKADAAGEPQWEAAHTFNQSWGEVVGIVPKPGSDVLVLYNTFENAEDFAVTQIYGGWYGDLDGAGGVVFNVPFSWALSDWAGAIEATSDRGFAVCGWTTSASVVPRELFISKANEYGIVEWTRIYDTPDATAPHAIRQTQDGGFIVVGKDTEPVNTPDQGLYLLRTDASGARVWSNTYGGKRGIDLVELPDGGFLAIGDEGFVVRVTASGEELWSMSYEFGPSMLFSVAQASDGGFVLAGWKAIPVGEDDETAVFIVKLAPEGMPTSVIDDPSAVRPDGPILEQNYPNPFNPGTTIEYELPHPSRVRLDIFNLLGQRVRSLLDESCPAGSYQAVWDGTDDTGSPVSTGVYFYRLEVDNAATTKKMLLLK